MKRNETKTRTVWYVQRGQEAICAFETKALAQAFANDIDFDVDIVQAKIIGSSSYPEMVNARYEDSLKATEPVVEESKPSGQIVWRYKVQFQWAGCKNGWEDCHCISCLRADDNPSDYDLDTVRGQYENTKATLQEAMSCVDKHSTLDISCDTRIKRIGHLV